MFFKDDLTTEVNFYIEECFKQHLKDMEKKIIDAPLNIYFDWESVSIEKIQEDLKKLKKAKATHVKVKRYDEYSLEFVAYTKREETDEEYQKRVKLEESLAKNRELQEKQQLEYLKKKYEN